MKNPFSPIEFDQVYLINLRRKPVRLAWALHQCQKLGIEPLVVDAFDAAEFGITSKFIKPPGAIGCTISHRIAFFHATANKYEKILVLEDDIFLDEDAIPQIEQIVQDFPPDCEIFWWGWDARDRKDTRRLAKLPVKQARIDKNVQLYGSQAISYHSRRAIAEMYENLVSVDTVYWENNHSDCAADILSAKLPVFAAPKSIFGQVREVSDIYPENRTKYKDKAWFAYVNFRETIDPQSV